MWPHYVLCVSAVHVLGCVLSVEMRKDACALVCQSSVQCPHQMYVHKHTYIPACLERMNLNFLSDLTAHQQLEA